MAVAAPVPEIALMAYPEAQLAAVHGLTDLFAVAERLARTRLGGSRPLLRVSHLVYDEATASVTRRFDTLPGAAGDAAFIILPPCLGEPPSGRGKLPLVDFLKARHGAGSVLASVCAGAFLLAETGLLDGRCATTHWLHAQRLADAFPGIRVDGDKPVIDDGDIITAGGLMAWTDLGLRLVDRILGPAAMIETARFLLIDPPGREQRSSSAFAPRPDHVRVSPNHENDLALSIPAFSSREPVSASLENAPRHGDAAVLKVQRWLQEAVLRDVAAGALAARAGLEERTFLRRFRKATGLTPTAYCQHLRVGRARGMLEATARPIDQIAWEVGYDDPAAFRRVFLRITGLSPGDYRRRFRATGTS